MAGLYLLRHGIAEADGTDPPLSAEGARQMRAEAAGLARLGLAFDAIISSPLRRAQETALIVAGLSGADGRLSVRTELAPGCRLLDLRALFNGHRDAGSILLVGHQPDMGRIAAELTGLKEPLSLERGALCCLEVSGWPPRPPARLDRVLLPAFLADQASG